MEQVKTQIREFLSRFFRNYDLKDDEDIFSVGFVNSMFAMELVMFVESKFNIKVENEDLALENFMSINAIAQLVNNKMKAGA